MEPKFVELRLSRKSLGVLFDLARAMGTDVSSALDYLIKEHERLLGEVQIEVTEQSTAAICVQ